MVPVLLSIFWAVVPLFPIKHPVVPEEMGTAELRVRDYVALDYDGGRCSAQIALPVEIWLVDHSKALEFSEEVVGASGRCLGARGRGTPPGGG